MAAAGHNTRYVQQAHVELLPGVPPLTPQNLQHLLGRAAPHQALCDLLRGEEGWQIHQDEDEGRANKGQP